MKKAYLLRAQYLGGFNDEFPCDSPWHRDIKVASNTTLEELNSILLAVINWEDNHLFTFTIRGNIYAWLGSDYFVVDERMFKGSFYSAAIPLSVLNLHEGEIIAHEFDFGDMHNFHFKVLRVYELTDTKDLPKLISMQGGSPPQYPDNTESHYLQKVWLNLNHSVEIPNDQNERENSKPRPGDSISFSKRPFSEQWIVRFVCGNDREVLEKWRRSKDKRKWEKAVVILENWNIEPDKIADKIERPLNAIKKWVQTFNWYGLEGLNKPRKKREEKSRRKKMEKRTKSLLEILHQPPLSFGVNRSNWSLQSIVDVFEKEHGESISKSTVSRLIKKAGYRIRKARKVLTSPDPDYREKVEMLLQTLQNLAKDEMFYFIDELGPLQVKKYGGRAFTPKGVQMTVPQNAKPKGSITLSGALSATTNQITWCYSAAKDTEAMIDLIEILFNQQFEKARLFITWDAASWHSSNDLIAWLDNFNAATKQSDTGPIIELVPLPKCSQFLDVIEAVFSGMKRAVIHHSDYQSKNKMKTAISKHFLDRNTYFKENPRRAGKKIWKVDFFTDYDNIRSGNYRDW